MNFESCKADLDVWFRPGIKDNGTEYMQYVLLYTNDSMYNGESKDILIGGVW